jgi:hypothetical protein
MKIAAYICLLVFITYAGWSAFKMYDTGFDWGRAVSVLAGLWLSYSVISTLRGGRSNKNMPT